MSNHPHGFNPHPDQSINRARAIPVRTVGNEFYPPGEWNSIGECARALGISEFSVRAAVKRAEAGVGGNRGGIIIRRATARKKATVST